MSQIAYLVAVASFRGGWGSADPPPRIVKCKSFALAVSSKGSLYISHNERLSHLMLMSVERSLVKSLALDDLVDDFAKLRMRRYPLLE